MSDETYIGEQAAVKCPDCGHETAILGVEEIPHAVLPINVPLNRCWTCGFTYTDYKAEEAESAYIAQHGWFLQERGGKTVSDKDKVLAKHYLKKWGADNCITMYTGLDELIETFASALATVRGEVRQEAFKEARRKVYMISGSTNVDPAVRKGFAAGVNTAIEVIAALERAADSREGESDAS